MKKLLLASAIGLCTVPAMAAGPANHPLLDGLKAASASRASTTTLPDLPLPPLTLEHSLTVPGFGKQADAVTKTTALPGIGTLTTYSMNDGKDASNGQAKFSRQLDIDPSSKSQVTSLSSDFVVPQKGQLSVTHEYKGNGYGKASTLDPKTVTLPLGGTFTSSSVNQGKGGSIDTVLNYTSPVPKTSSN